MTHEEIVLLADRWLCENGYNLRMCRGKYKFGEKPDAIGWKEDGSSCQIECKVSRSDFKHDKSKWFRKNNESVCKLRFFMTPPGLVSYDEIPDTWGLIEVEAGNISPRYKGVKDATPNHRLTSKKREAVLRAYAEMYWP